MVDGDGRVEGLLTLELIEQLLATRRRAAAGDDAGAAGASTPP